MLQLHPLREPLSQGIGLFGLLRSSSSRPAPGRMLSRQLVLTTIIVVSSVGVRVTLLKCAPKRDNLRGRLSAEMIKTKARSRLSKSGRATSTSPTWLIFLREHQ